MGLRPKAAFNWHQFCDQLDSDGISLPISASIWPFWRPNAPLSSSTWPKMQNVTPLLVPDGPFRGFKHNSSTLIQSCARKDKHSAVPCLRRCSLRMFGFVIWSECTQKPVVCDHMGLTICAKGTFCLIFCLSLVRRSSKSTTSRRLFGYASPATKRMSWRVLASKFVIWRMKTVLSHRPTSSTSGSKCWRWSE